MQRVYDHSALQQLLTNSGWQMTLSMFSLLIFGTALAFFKPELFAIFMIGGGLYLTYVALFIKRQRILSNKNFRLSAQKQGAIVEFLAGMQEIKLNNADRQRRRQWETTQQDLAELRVKTQLLNYIQNSGGQAINEATGLLITLLVAIKVVDGELSLGTMVAVQFIVGQLSWPLSSITLLIAQSHEAALSFERAREIHHIRDEGSGAKRGMPAGSEGLEFKNVAFAYGGSASRPLFRDLNLEIPYGKMTAIVGRSGSGKTTLMKLMLQFYPVNNGEILMGGVNLNDISPRQWRSRCGVVMQDGYIFSDTVLSNIAMSGKKYDLERAIEVSRIARIDSLIESLPMAYRTRIGRDGVGISRGQAQRILIARALYKDPQYLFFDEATSALDAETESVIVNQLQSIIRNKTAVVIAHRMSTVRHADQIIVVDGGRIVEAGRHDELVEKRGNYFELVRNQLDIEA